jgi:hypothetical protein
VEPLIPPVSPSRSEGPSWSGSRRLLPCCLAALLAVGTCHADELADRLKPHVGTTIDLVELNTGKRFVRPVLDGLTNKDGAVTGLTIKPEGGVRATRLGLNSIVKIVAARETIHEAAPQAAGSTSSRGSRAREAYERQRAESAARMREHNVTPWPALSAADHAAEVEALKKFVAEVQTAFPALQLAETHEFLVASDIPADQMRPYVASLDSMHDFLCDLYAIPRGEPVWKGKCLVVAFLEEQDYGAFEARFMRTDTRGTHGLCHQRSDGRVIMACHRGPDAPAFAHMLVHETSHGFNHRWMSPQRIPNWLNEGIAEWVGTKVVPGSNQVALKEAKAAEYMRSSGNMGQDFFTAQNIAAVQYGIASSLVRFLARDPKKFAAFVRSVKEGVPVDEALEAVYKGSFDDLVKSYGAAVGVPHLKR